MLTRPVLPDFIATPAELAAPSEDLFDAFRRGLLRPGEIHQRPITEAAQAHRDLEARRTSGHTVFTL